MFLHAVRSGARSLLRSCDVAETNQRKEELKVECMRLRSSLFLIIALFVTVDLHAQNVVTEWNTIASTMIVENGGKPSHASGVFFAYTSIAVYDAVNSIHRQFQPIYYKGNAPNGASDEAAAVAAAHRILVRYFPAQQPALDAKFSYALEKIRADSDAKTAGTAAGEAAADALIAARANDGLEANVAYTPGTGLGVWQPTRPKFLPALTPWLGQMRPFTMTGAAQFLPDGPTPLTSNEWTDEYDQVRTLGEINSAARTRKQTEIGLFWTEHTGQQYARAFGYLAENYKLDVMASARLMAILWTGYADSVIGCFNAKYHYSFWRPETAILAGAGNSKMASDANWNPLATTPNHPEYPAAHGCITGTVSSLIENYFGTSKVHIVVDSLVFDDGIHKHIFEDTHDLFDEVFWARIYAGLHYHHSLEDGGSLGKRISEQLLRKYFRPQNKTGGDISHRDDKSTRP